MTCSGPGGRGGGWTTAPLPHSAAAMVRIKSGSVVDLAEFQKWRSLLQRLKTDEGRSEASVRGTAGRLPLHTAAWQGAPEEVVRALLYTYPEGAGRKDRSGKVPLHCASCIDPSRGQPWVRAVRMLLEANPGAAKSQDEDGLVPGELLDIDDCPKVCVMLALARANHPPNRPWTTRTHSILEGIAATLPNSGASTLIDAHLARVRAFLLVARRRGLPAELTHRVVSHVYLLDFWED